LFQSNDFSFSSLFFGRPKRSRFRLPIKKPLEKSHSRAALIDVNHSPRKLNEHKQKRLTKKLLFLSPLFLHEIIGRRRIQVKHKKHRSHIKSQFHRLTSCRHSPRLALPLVFVLILCAICDVTGKQSPRESHCSRKGLAGASGCTIQSSTFR
jgi:hypothetical protein